MQFKKKKQKITHVLAKYGYHRMSENNPVCFHYLYKMQYVK